MKRILVYTFVLAFLISGVVMATIDKTSSKKSKSESSEQKKQDAKKEDTAKKKNQKNYNDFVDKNSNGIDDRVEARKKKPAPDQKANQKTDKNKESSSDTAGKKE